MNGKTTGLPLLSMSSAHMRVLHEETLAARRELQPLPYIVSSR